MESINSRTQRMTDRDRKKFKEKHEPMFRQKKNKVKKSKVTK